MYKEGQSSDGDRASWKKEKEDGEVCNERVEWQQISESDSKNTCCAGEVLPSRATLELLLAIILLMDTIKNILHKL